MTRPLRLFLILLAMVGIGSYWLLTNLDYLAEEAIIRTGNALTGARISVDAVKIAAASGKGAMSRLEISNPPGFAAPYAFQAEKVELLLDVGSVAKDVILVRLIIIDGPDVIYEKGPATTNFDAIQKNIAAHVASHRTRGGDGETRLIVEELTICNARAQARAHFMGSKSISIPLPDITLRNIGLATGGVTPGELGLEVAGVLRTKLAGAVSFERLLQSTGDVSDKPGPVARNTLKYPTPAGGRQAPPVIQ